MEPAPPTISTSITFWTFYRVSLAIGYRSPSLFIGLAIFAMFPLLPYIMELSSHSYPYQSLPWLGTIILLVMVSLFYLFLFVPIIGLLTTWLRFRRYPALKGIHTHTFLPEGISMKGDLFDSLVKWPAFLKAVETRKFILYYITPRMAHFIIKAAATPEQIESIRRITREQLGAKAKLY